MMIRSTPQIITVFLLAMVMAVGSAVAGDEDSAGPSGENDHRAASSQTAAQQVARTSGPVDDHAGSGPLGDLMKGLENGDTGRESGKNTDSGQDSGLEGGWMVRYFVSLVVIAGLLAGGFLLLRTVRGKIMGHSGFQSGVRVLGRVPLDKRNTLFLVHIRGEDLVIASGQQGAQLITRYEGSDQDGSRANPYTPETSHGRETAYPQQESGFWAALKSMRR